VSQRQNDDIILVEAGIYKHYYRRELVSGFRRKEKPKPKNGIATQSVRRDDTIESKNTARHSPARRNQSHVGIFGCRTMKLYGDTAPGEEDHRRSNSRNRQQEQSVTRRHLSSTALVKLCHGLTEIFISLPAIRQDHVNIP
jgi:hypothetical protein